MKRMYAAVVFFLGNKSSPPPRGVSWLTRTGLCKPSHFLLNNTTHIHTVEMIHVPSLKEQNIEEAAITSKAENMYVLNIIVQIVYSFQFYNIYLKEHIRS
jgi:hypothetical protein